MSTSPVCTGSHPALTCSWLPASESALPSFIHIFPHGDAAMDEAETKMTSSMEACRCEAAEGVVLATTEHGRAAPFIFLTPSACPVVALCVASNARLLEIHAGDGQTKAPPLLTCAATGMGSGAWYTHYLVSDVTKPLDTPLLPPGTQGYTIKFFGRRPSSVLKIACACIVYGAKDALDEAHISQTGTSEESPLPACATTESQVADMTADKQDALALCVRRMETQMTVMMQLIMRRLDAVEMRLSRLEAHE